MHLGYTNRLSRPTGGRSESLKTQSPRIPSRVHTCASWACSHTLLVSLASTALARATLPPRLACSASFARHLACCELLAARAASFARRSSPELLELRSHRPANRAFCSRLPLASLSPARQLLAPLALPSARSALHLSCCSLRSPPCLLLSPLAAPPAALGLASLAFSPFRLLTADAGHPPRSRFARLASIGVRHRPQPAVVLNPFVCESELSDETAHSC